MAATQSFLKRIEIRLNRSEVTNYLASIGKAPVPQSDGIVTIKTEPRDENESELCPVPVIVRTESLHNPEQEVVSCRVKGFKCPTCQLTFKYRLHLKNHQSTNQRCAVRHNSEVEVKLDTDADTSNSNVPGKEKHSCPVCKKELAQSSSLDRHMTSFNSIEKPYACKTCLHTFKLQTNCDAHAKNKHKHKCHDCELSFIYKSSLEKHRIKCHQADPRKYFTFTCPECKKEFKTKHILLGHMKVHRKERPFVCPTCQNTFKWKNHLLRHTREVHLVKSNAKAPVSLTDTTIKQEPRSEDDLPITIKAASLHDSEVSVYRKVFQCPTCQLIFKYRLHLRHHQNTNKKCAVQCNQTNDVKLQKHPNRPYVCSKCLQRFKQEDNFNYHTLKEHPFNCQHCELTFPYKPNLDGHITKYHRHRITNMGEGIYNESDKSDKAVSRNNFSCPQCNKVFVAFPNLRCHMALHSSERSYACSKCQVTFKFESALNSHTQKDHKYKCDHCELIFLKKQGRDRESHMLRCHPDIILNNMTDGYGAPVLNQSEFRCHECNREFSHSSSLNRHVASIHSIKKTYLCSTCLHTFKLSYSRDTHAQKDHKYKCENCKLAFVRKSSVEEHAVKEHQAVPQLCLSCPECKKVFSQSNHLRRHMKVHSNRKPYVCSTCQIIFKYENNLISHTRKEHVVKCDKCMLLFACRKHFKEHYLLQHTVDEGT